MPPSTRPADITAEMFRKWRSPVHGALNPHPMSNPVWKWLVESRLTAYEANRLFAGEPASCGVGPGWCFSRYGQSCTPLPDRRTVWIGGEHEDYYDPDFYIYNDVVITSPGGEVEIFGYSPEVFPPTDFHSATLVNGQVVLIGNLGYAARRQTGITPVLTLELDRWRISVLQTAGEGPGWLHKHDARLEDDGRGILITGGWVDRCDGNPLVENIDDWRLALEDGRWQRLTARRWVRFEVYRKDKGANHLWAMRQALWERGAGWDDDAEKSERALRSVLGSPAKLDILPCLYRPGIPHELLPEDPERHGVYRIQAGGVVVRYVEDTYGVQVTVEGELPAVAIERIRQDLMGKLQELEQSAIDCREIAAS